MPSLIRHSLIFVALCLLALTATTAYAAEAKTQSRLRNAGQPLVIAQNAADEEYLKGEPARALQHLRSAANENSWYSILALGNTIWTLHPELSFQLHQQAYAMSGRDNYALMELAYDYTRQDKCNKAIQAWQKLDKAGLLQSYQPMLAGYCYLKLGQDNAAFLMFDRAELGRHAAFENVLKQLWGPRPAIIMHADYLRDFKTTGNLDDLHAGILNAIRFGTGTQFRSKALLAFMDAAKPFANDLEQTASQLDCLRPAFEDEMRIADTAATSDVRNGLLKKAWKQRLDACGLLIDGQRLPDDSVIARLLVVTARSLQLASAEDLLRDHKETLTARSRSSSGDIESLRVLASLQEQAKDPDLPGTNELGWSRYADPVFAVSLIASQLLDQYSATPDALALIERAHAQFPDNPKILDMWLRYAKPAAGDARAGWRQLALLEFHQPSLHTDQTHFVSRAMTLYRALVRYRQAADLCTPKNSVTRQSDTPFNCPATGPESAR